jgi:hypothetical protein
VEAVYRPFAQQARMQGTVKFGMLVGLVREGGKLQLLSGPPLLVQAERKLGEMAAEIEVKFTLP